MNEGIYVHRVTRGFKRWFFNVSVPREWLDHLADEGRTIREPDQVGKDFAVYLEKLFSARTTAPMATPGGDALALSERPPPGGSLRS